MGRFLLAILLSLFVLQRPLFARDILGHTCKIALAVAKSNSVSRWILRKIKNKILERTVPIPNQPAHLQVESAKNADSLTRKQLDEMGVGYKAVEGLTWAQQLLNNKEITADTDALKSVSLYELTSLKETQGKNDPATNTLEHPDFPKALEELKKKGYKFYVDSSIAATGAGALVDMTDKTVTIKANLEWLKFQHELVHVDYEEAKGLGLFDLENAPNIEAYPDLKSLVERAKILRTRGLRDITVHEMLATEKERDVLTQFGYKPYAPVYQNRVQYSRRYIIGDILNTPPEKRTAQQLSILTKALIEFETGMDMETTRLWSGLSPSKRVAVIGTMTALGGAGLTMWILANKNRTTDDEKEEEKEVLIQTQDGEWIRVK